MSKTTLKFSTGRAVLAISIMLGALAVGCTGDKNQPKFSNAYLNGTKATSSEALACSADDLSAFERVDGEMIDLNKETLPRGLFLARDMQMLVEKKTDRGISRALIRETVGGKGAEIACSENLDQLQQETIDISIKGLVKFETTESPLGSKFTLRQILFFQDKSGFGAYLSNAKALVGQNQQDLKGLLSFPLQPGQIVRLPDHSYALRYLRERDGLRARLLVHLDLIQ